MSNYLTKEEIRQWRSSLEKITLEEFAARLGKKVEENKSTNDVVDIVMSKGTSSNTNHSINDSFSAIAERAFMRERQISHTPFSIRKNDFEAKINDSKKTKKDAPYDNTTKNIIDKVINQNDNKKSVLENVVKHNSNPEANIIFKKALTDREQLVFEYFLNNIGEIVYAKDLAELLDLPRDYVYKYIKNLRAKIEGDKLINAPSGGFILTE